jgi:hypothetical protein
MKAALFPILFICGTAQAQILADFQWKKRLLIFPQASVAQLNEWESLNAQTEDRDLKILILQTPPGEAYQSSPQITTELLARLKPNAKKPTIFLIGKDGKTTQSWPVSEFTFAKLFAAIDAMPMRKRELAK